MKPLKKLALIPILALVGFTAAQVAIPAAHGDDTVKVRASILFNLDGVMGYVRFGEPVFPRIIERVAEPVVVYVYREPPRTVVIHEYARPVVIVNERRDNDRMVWGHQNGKNKQARKIVVINRDNRGNERNIENNARPARNENRDARGNTRQVVERRNGKTGHND